MINQLPALRPSTSESGCCPRLQPEQWDQQEFVLDEMLFAKTSTRNLFHIPINMGKIMTRSMTVIEEAGVGLEDDYLILARDVSPWRCDHFFRIAKEIPDESNTAGLDMVRLSGTFLTRVFEGPYANMNKWITDMTAYIQGLDRSIEAIYAFYTTCPKCARVYGKNYVVLFAKVA